MELPFSDEEIYEAVRYHLPKVEEYVRSHGGGIQVLGVKDGQVYIQLTGTCHGCSMSLMTTKMVVEKRLRELIHPNLVLINVEAGQEEQLPEGLYTGKPERFEPDKEKGLMDKIRKIL